MRIGAIYNLEGSQSPLDLPSARGAWLAVKEINALGGIGGSEIELNLCDGKSDPELVSECAERLLDLNISAMMGLSDTDMVLAAAPVAALAEVPFVTSGATSPRLVEEYEGLFLACFGDNVQARAGAEYAYNEMDLKTCSLLVDGDMEYARLLAGYFKERYLDLGGEITMEAFVNGSVLDSLSQSIGDRNPDMIYLAVGPDKARTIVEVVRKAGIHCPIFGGDSLDSPELREEGMGRIIFSTHALLDEDSSTTGEFFRAYQAEYGHPPENAFSALGYDTVNLLVEAIDRAGSVDPQAIHEALQNTSRFRGVTGEISYQIGGRIPNKGVTMILLIDGEIAGSEIITPEPALSETDAAPSIAT
ncbi:MAG: ABC transporter substrate-binding protein [Methanotrichaceae archaeon]|nr:ABC transporter substrate-binding protein [Methanotrichaceae archaeon]